jgi:hypothetical protein
VGSRTTRAPTVRAIAVGAFAVARLVVSSRCGPLRGALCRSDEAYDETTKRLCDAPIAIGGQRCHAWLPIEPQVRCT